MTNVVNEVKILLESVWLIHLLTRSFKLSFLPMTARLSLIRSNITIVSLIEYPTIVSIAAMKVVSDRIAELDKQIQEYVKKLAFMETDPNVKVVAKRTFDQLRDKVA